MQNNRVQQAKDISLQSVLSKMGYKPTRDTPIRAWYNSPFRGESVPSFMVKKDKNWFSDWGSGAKGDVIDFVRKHESCTFREALDFILDDNHNYRKHTFDDSIDVTKIGIDILDVRPIKSKHLLTYAESRCINRDLLNLYCMEVDYAYRSWEHVIHNAIGFENDKGGWELRNHKQKVGNSPKSWRTVRGRDSENANLFEGFFDFLSFLQYNQWDTPDFDSFIMNSLSFSSFIKDEVEDFDKVFLYLDNDHAAQQKIDDYFTGEKFIDIRGTYSEYEDFNDFVKSQI